MMRCLLPLPLRKALLVSAALLGGCSSPRPFESAAENTYAPSTDPVRVHHARGFDIDYSEAYPILSINGSADTTRYALLPASEAPPAEFIPVRTPVRRLVVTSTTHLGLVELLDARDQLVGIGQADYVYDADIRRRVKQATDSGGGRGR